MLVRLSECARFVQWLSAGNGNDEIPTPAKSPLGQAFQLTPFPLGGILLAWREVDDEVRLRE